MPKGSGLPPKEAPIRFNNVDKMWRNGIYSNTDEPFKVNRLTNINEIRQFYSKGEPALNLPLPPYDPTSTITLNTPEGIEKQWRIYLQKTGHKL